MSRIPDKVAGRESRESKLRGFAAVAKRVSPGHIPSWLLSLAALLMAVTAAHAQKAFGPIAVGISTPPTQSVSVTAPAGGTVASVAILTAGAPNLDFTAGSGPSCISSTPLAAGASCAQSVKFSPTAPGVRAGAVVLLDSAGNVLGTAYLSGTGLGALGVFTPGNIIPVAGDGDYEGPVENGGPALQGVLNHPSSVALDGAGNMYIADRYHHMIRMVCAGAASATIYGANCTAAGIITTIAGNGNPAYTGDAGAASASTLNTPWGLALDGAGNLYIADTGNNVVRVITAATGIITTIAGNGSGCLGQSDSVGDNCAATSAMLNSPQGITLDSSGNLYIADTANHRIRIVNPISGIITTIAGNGFTNTNGSGGFSGDNGKASQAELNYPFAVAFDPTGNMYIPDSANNAVRVVTATGGVINGNCTITTFAGTPGTPGYSGDGAPANLATLFAPSGVVADPAGNVYIADTQNAAIRKVDSAASTTAGIISTVAKNGVNQTYVAGAFVDVDIYGPLGLFMDGRGNLFFADSLNMRIRKIQGNYAALNYLLYAVRQGSESGPQDQRFENDGNAPLDLTILNPVENSALDAAETTCATGSPYMAVDADCIVGVQFAPSTSISPSNPEFGTFDIGNPGDTANSPLNIELVGIGAPVNSTTTTLTSTPDPSAYGVSVTFTATVTTGPASGDLTGTVSFFDGTTPLAANVALNASAGTTATATFATRALTVGVHSITATYNAQNSADSGHFSSTSDPIAQTVEESSATTLTSSANPSILGAGVTLTATVTISGGGGIAPDGAVTFMNGATLLGSSTLSPAGVATYTTSALPQGINSITATYNGDANKTIVASTSNTLNQDVRASSPTAIASAPNPSNYGIPVTFTVTVAPGGTASPTGLVNILDGVQQIGQVSLAGATGQATYTTSTLTAGLHSIIAAYQGDTNNAASTSPAITQTVNVAQTSTTILSIPNPGIAGANEAITATVKVIASATAATGSVTFTDGTTNLGSASLGAGGTAVINPILAPGPHSIVATYSGDANDNGSASGPYILNVNLATTATSVSVTPNPAQVQATVTFIATVTGNGAVPTGTVTFSANNAPMGSANLIGGTATFTYSALAVGSYSITAVYGGDTNNLKSSGTSSAQLVVGSIPTVTDLGSSTTGGTMAQTILVSTVLNTSGNSTPAPTGTVTFFNGTTVVGSGPLDASGVATLALNLPVGSYSIDAYYSGDLLHGASTSPAVTVVVPGTGFNLTVTPSAVTVATKQNVTVTVMLASLDGFADTVGLGCASLPAGVTCHFSSASANVTANESPAPTVQLTIDTDYPLTGGSSAMNSHPKTPGAALAGVCLPFSLLFGWVVWRFRGKHSRVVTMMLALLLSVATLLVSGCGEISYSSAAPGTYVIQVTGVGTSSEIAHYQNVTLNITQ